MKKFRFTKRPAESLIEVVIAIFVVSLAAGTASTLIVSALQSNSFSRDNLIALNLADEGLEAMRDIRDINWLKFSFDSKSCWDIMSNETTCNLNNHITDGLYSVHLNQDYAWQLDILNQSTPLPLNIISSGSNPPIKIYSSDLLLNENPAIFSKFDTTNPFYGRFSRVIQITHLGPNKMQVTSNVQWTAQGVIHTVSHSSFLTNYQM
ncbi:MAG: hypothetical protein WC843_00040 [Candidatus Gracilibacteria bacterium]|jgi:hypothetical protein